MKKKFVILQSLTTRDRFYSMTAEGHDPTVMNDGSIGYKILAEVDTDYEAQTFLFGEEFAKREQERRKQEGRE